MGLLSQREVVTVPPETLHKVLVVSSFASTDGLRNVLSAALEALKSRWEGKMKVAFHRVLSVPELIKVLNASEATILIFDGHGIADSGDGIGKLIIGREQVDVWSLRGKIPVPSILILSACDTHGVDSPSHMTVGNGFLFLGAMTVVASLLSLRGTSSAEFVVRLVYRLVDFIPEAAQKRVLNWTEILSGMQRMFLASEILRGLIGPPDIEGSPRWKMEREANMDINSYDPDWFENLLSRIAEYRGEEYDFILERVSRIIALSEAIRYVQLGHTESIRVDDGGIREQFVLAHLLGNKRSTADRSTVNGRRASASRPF